MSIKLQTARKDHVCTECGRKILKGERYWRKQSTITHLGETHVIVDSKTHINCELYRGRE